MQAAFLTSIWQLFSFQPLYYRDSNPKTPDPHIHVILRASPKESLALKRKVTSRPKFVNNGTTVVFYAVISLRITWLTAMTSPPTVFLVDDDPGVRDALSLSLKTAGLNVEAYDTAESFLAAYCCDRPGCLVLDVRMPQMSGLELQEALKANRIKIPIIFITGHGDIPMSVRAIKAGALDFLEKPFRMQVLLERVQEAMAKDARVRESDTDKQAVIGRYMRLTPREREIMSLIIEGKSSKEIAKELHVSPRTVETHRSRIIDKMEAKSLSDLVAMSFSCGLNQLT